MIVPAPDGARCLEVPADAPLWQEFRFAVSTERLNRPSANRKRRSSISRGLQSIRGAIRGSVGAAESSTRHRHAGAVGLIERRRRRYRRRCARALRRQSQWQDYMRGGTPARNRPGPAVAPGVPVHARWGRGWRCVRVDRFARVAVPLPGYRFGPRCGGADLVCRLRSAASLRGLRFRSSAFIG